MRLVSSAFLALILGVPALTTQPTQAAPAADAVTVAMSDALTFEPVLITVPVGSTVTWVNQGSAPHTVTAEAFDSGSDPADWIMGGGSWAVTITAPGTYDYVCLPHETEGMVGTVVVK